MLVYNRGQKWQRGGHARAGHSIVIAPTGRPLRTKLCRYTVAVDEDRLPPTWQASPSGTLWCKCAADAPYVVDMRFGLVARGIRLSPFSSDAAAARSLFLNGSEHKKRDRKAMRDSVTRM